MDSDEEGRYQKVRRRILFERIKGKSIVRLDPQVVTPLALISSFAHIRCLFPGHSPSIQRQSYRKYVQRPRKDDSRQENAAVGFAASHQRGLALVLKSPESATTQFRGMVYPCLRRKRNKTRMTRATTRRLVYGLVVVHRSTEYPGTLWCINGSSGAWNCFSCHTKCKNSLHRT